MPKTQTTKIARPPIVAVLGHVDHGKTTLLDTIRKSDVAKKEHGGITQHIGAYQITVSSQNEPLSRANEVSRGIPSENKDILRQGFGGELSRTAQDDFAQNMRKITFIDTPGHEAFSKMRQRGSTAADIAILVVAANDGVKPQTEESIRHIKAAGIPYVVAINQMDLPDVDEKKVKRELSDKDVLVEGFGGDIVALPVSGKTGKGVDKLLEVILLLGEMQGITAEASGEVSGVVIESKQDKQKGVLATVIVKNGTLNIGDTVYAEKTRAKVKNLIDDAGQSLKSAGPGTPVVIMGFDSLPQIGAVVSAEAKSDVGQNEAAVSKPFSLPPLEESKKLRIILKSDVAGSLEAIIGSLPENTEIVHTGVGAVNDSDILLAKSTGAFVIGFNVAIPTPVKKLAELEKVRVKSYTIIYELLDQIKEVVEIMNQPVTDEEFGKAEIIAEFESSGERVAGSRVVEGFITKGAQIKLIRQEKEIGRTRIRTMRHLKEEISKAEKGMECGVLLDKKLDFKLGDIIIAYKVHEPVL